MKHQDRLHEDPKAREKLLRARAEIEAIFQRYDIAALCIMHADPSSAEVILNLSPSYSNIKMEGDRAAIKSTTEMYGGDIERRLYDLRATSNMASTLAELAAMGALQIKPLADALDKATGATHTELTHLRPH